MIEDYDYESITSLTRAPPSPPSNPTAFAIHTSRASPDNPLTPDFVACSGGIYPHWFRMQDVSTLPGAEALPLDAPLVRPRPLRRFSMRAFSGTMCNVVLVVLLFQTWLVQGYRVYGCCMEPNLWTGERLLATRVDARKNLHRGEVVVFYPPHRPDTPFIKRIIGMPGDVMEIRANHVFINGQEIQEPYLRRAWHDDRAAERIPDGNVFVMGDNRDNSNDSRAWGDLPIDHIQAKAWLRYWPLNRVGWIN